MIKFNKYIRGFFNINHFIFFLLLTAIFLVYLPALEIPFYVADTFNIIGNPFVRKFDNFVERMLTLKGLTQRPLSILSFTFNYSLSELNSKFYFLTNIIIHIFNTALVYLLARRFIKIPLIAAALFGLHPMASDAVSILQGRSYSLGTIFLMLGMISLTSKNHRKYWFCFLSFIGMVLSKQSFVFFLPIMVAHFFYSGDRPGFKKLIQSKSSIVMLIVSILLAFHIFNLHGLGKTPSAYVTPIVFFISQISNLHEILSRYFWPELSIFIEYPWYRTIGLSFVLNSILIFGALFYIAKRYRKPDGFLLICFILSIVPTNSIIPKNEVLIGWRLYPSLVFFSLFMGYWIGIFFESKKIELLGKQAIGALFIGLLILYGIMTSKQNHLYQNEELTYTRGLELFPDSEKGKELLVNRFVRLRKNQEAISLAKEILEANPRHIRMRLFLQRMENKRTLSSDGKNSR